MLIFLDTNILAADFRLSGPLFRLLLENFSNFNYGLCIPKIVFMETTNLFKEELCKETDKINGSLLKVKYLTDKSYIFPIDRHNLNNLVNEYEMFLKKKLEQFNVSILPIPKTSHIELVRRDLDRRKPFTKKGKGYRDALIWETILSTAKATRKEIAFITNNSRDFAGDDKKLLHPDLEKDLQNLNFAKEKFHLFSDLDDYVNKHIMPHLPPAKKTMAIFRDTKYSTFENALYEALQTQLIGYEIDSQEIGLSYEFENPTIELVKKVNSVEVDQEVKTISNNENVLKIRAMLLCKINLPVDENKIEKVSWKGPIRAKKISWQKIDRYYIKKTNNMIAIEVNNINYKKYWNIQAELYVTIDVREKKITGTDVLEVNIISPSNSK